MVTSREGLLRGSFCDGDERTTYMTNDGHRRDRDFFAVEFAESRTIDRVLFIHGRFLPGGGWWATHGADGTELGKPAIEFRSVRDGPWQGLAVIKNYPRSTPDDRGDVEPHSMYVVEIPPTRVAAVRVIGTPSNGATPSQNLVSCAELDVHVVADG
jgi:hypothetical protein